MPKLIDRKAEEDADKSNRLDFRFSEQQCSISSSVMIV
jgi:hypothetical protein